MKALQMFIMALMPFFILGQSPQCVNFAGSTSFGWSLNRMSNIVVQDSNLWFAVNGTLIKENKVTGEQTRYKPENSNIIGSGVTTVALSPNGILWGGGVYGLWQFDGMNFINYITTTSGDTLDNVGDIEWDAAGNMYVCALISPSATGQSNTMDLLKYDGNTLVRMNMPHPYFGGFTQNAMCVKSNGEIYYAYGGSTYIDSCSYFDGLSWISLPLPNNTCHVFLLDNMQQLLAFPTQFSTGVNNIYTLTGNVWTSQAYTWTNPPISTLLTRGAIIGNNNDIFVYANAELLKIVNNNIINYPYSITAPSNSKQFKGIVTDINGDIWLTYMNTPTLSEWDFQTVKFSNNQWYSSPYNSDLPKANYFKIDDFNRKWVSSWFYLGQFDGHTWNYISIPNGKELAAGRAYTFDNQGNLWAILETTATYSDSLYKYSNGLWTCIRYAPNASQGICIDDVGRICIGGYSRVDYFDGMAWNIFYNSGAPNANLPFTGFITHIFVDDNHTFWMCTSNGLLASFDGMNFGNLMQLGGASNEISWDISERIWISNYDTKTTYVIEDSIITQTFNTNSAPILGTARIEHGCSDLNGNDWITTSQGLFKHSNGNWTKYDVFNSDLASNNSTEIYVDNANNLWVLSNAGLTIFNETGMGQVPLSTVSNTWKGSVYFDKNNNGIKDTLECNLPSQKIHIQPENIHQYTNTNGIYEYIHPQNPGTHVLEIKPYPNWTLSSDSAMYHIMGNSSIDSLDFGLYATNPLDSLTTAIYSGQPRCDNQVPYWFFYQNKGTTTLQGSVMLTLDSLISNFTSFPSPATNTTFIYTWNFQNLLPFETRVINFSVLMPDFNFTGTNITTFANVSYTSSAVNNDSVNTQHVNIIGCAIDPNDKTALLPEGASNGNEVLQNTDFTYMIRFQNTGNDVAFSVTIRDTLDTDWDISTFEVLASSNTLQTKIENNNILEFHFPNIMLPDSGTNEAASHGFVSYRIKPNPNLPDYTVLQNTASIYFDNNPPVTTNTTSHTLVSAFTDVSDKDVWEPLLYYPNPMQDFGIICFSNPKRQDYTFTLFDINGKLMLQTKSNDNQMKISSKNWMQGIYIFSLTNGNTTKWGKWLKQ